MLKVAVTQAPEKGKANGAIARVIAEALELRPSQIELLSGATSPQKQFLIREVQTDMLKERVAAILSEIDRTG